MPSEELKRRYKEMMRARGIEYEPGMPLSQPLELLVPPELPEDVGRARGLLGEAAQSTLGFAGRAVTGLGTLMEAIPLGVPIPAGGVSLDTRLTGRGLQEIGKGITKGIEKVAPVSYYHHGKLFPEQVLSGFGTAGTMIGAALITGGLGIPGIWGVVGVGAFAQSQSMYDEALAKTGGNKEKASMAFLAGLPIGGIEGLSELALLGRINRMSGGAITRVAAKAVPKFIARVSTKRAARYGANVVVTGFTEMMEEIIQGGFENLSAQQIYDESRRWHDNIVQGGAVGFIVGATLGAGGSYVAYRWQRTTDPDAKAKLEQAVEIIEDARKQWADNTAESVRLAEMPDAEWGESKPKIVEKLLSGDMMAAPLHFAQHIQKGIEDGSVIWQLLSDEKELSKAAKNINKQSLSKIARINQTIGGTNLLLGDQATETMADLSKLIESGGKYGAATTYQNYLQNAITNEEPLTIVYSTRPDQRILTNIRWMKGKKAIRASDSYSGEERTFTISNIQSIEGVQEAPTVSKITQQLYNAWTELTEAEQRLLVGANLARMQAAKGNVGLRDKLWKRVGKTVGMSKEQAMDFFLQSQEYHAEQAVKELGVETEAEGRSTEEIAQATSETLKDAGVESETAEKASDEYAKLLNQGTAKGVTPEQVNQLRSMGYTAEQVVRLSPKAATRIVDENLPPESVTITKGGVLRIKKKPVVEEIPLESAEGAPPVERPPTEMYEGVPPPVEKVSREVARKQVADALAEAGAPPEMIVPTKEAAPGVPVERLPERPPAIEEERVLAREIPAEIPVEERGIALAERVGITPTREVAAGELPIAEGRAPKEVTLPEGIAEVAGEPEFREAPVKEPWEMTSDEYAIDSGYKKSQGSRVRENWRGQHEGIIRVALQQGKPVPEEVLAEYPDLRPERGAEIPTERPPAVRPGGLSKILWSTRNETTIGRTKIKAGTRVRIIDEEIQPTTGTEHYIIVDDQNRRFPISKTEFPTLFEEVRGVEIERPERPRPTEAVEEPTREAAEAAPRPTEAQVSIRPYSTQAAREPVERSDIPSIGEGRAEELEGIGETVAGGIYGGRIVRPPEYEGLALTRGKIPDTVGGRIDDPIRGLLRPHQVHATEMTLDAHESGKAFLNAGGTGSGKTIYALTLADYYTKQGQKTLIVTQNQRVINTAFKPDAELLGVDMGDPNITIIPYSQLKNVEERDYDLIILDESQNLKNWQTSQQGLRGLRMIDKTPNVVYMSATPFDKPEHMWYLHKLGMFMDKQDFYAWMNNIGMEFAQTKRGGYWRRGREVSEVGIVKSISDMYDRLAEDGVLQRVEVSLENLDIEFRSLELSDESLKKLEDIQKYYEGQIADLEAKGQGNMLGLKKAEMLMAMRRHQEPEKIKALMDIIKRELMDAENPKRQVIVFAELINPTQVGGKRTVTRYGRKMEIEEPLVAQSPGTIPTIINNLKKEGINVAEVTGRITTEAAKTSEIDAFQKGEKRVLIATRGSAGAGLNLDDIVGDAPRTMIIVTAPFSAMDNIQMAGRHNRMTTKSKSRLIYLFTNTSVDNWNRDIIGRKMGALGGAVKGEIGKLDVTGRLITPERPVEIPERIPEGVTPRPIEEVAPVEKAPPEITETEIKKQVVKEINKAVRVGQRIPLPTHEGVQYVSELSLSSTGNILARFGRSKQRFHLTDEQIQKFIDLVNANTDVGIPNLIEYGPPEPPISSKSKLIRSLPNAEIGDDITYAHPAPREGQQAEWPATYAVVEADDIITSNKERNDFIKDSRYPEGVNEDKNYQDPDSIEQAKVIERAVSLDPDQLVNTAKTSIEGPPIITPVEHIALSGNGRTMSIRLADEKQYAKYRGKLENDAVLFGMDTDKVKAMAHPVLVRVIDVSKDDWMEFASMANQSPSVALDEIGTALQVSKYISNDVISKMSLDPDETLRQFLDTTRGRQFVEIAKRAIPQNDWGRYFAPNNKLTDAGKEMLENALFGKLFHDRDFLRQLPPSIRNSLEKSIPPLINIKQGIDSGAIPPEWDVVEAIVKAVGFHQRNLKDMPLDMYLKQQDFIEKEPFDENALWGQTLLLMDKFGHKSRVLANKFKTFYDEASDLFSKGKTPVDAMRVLHEPLPSKSADEKTIETLSEFLKSEGGFARVPTAKDMREVAERLRKINQSDTVKDVKDKFKVVGGHYAVTPELMINSQGPTGRIYTKTIRDVEKAAKQKAGKAIYGKIIPLWKKVSELEWQNGIDVLEGKANAINENAQKVADVLKEEFDRVGDEWEGMDGTIRIYQPNGDYVDVPFKKKKDYFPHAYPKEMFDDKEFFSDVVKQMAQKSGMTEEMARKVLEQANLDRTGLFMANLELPRLFDMPGYRRDVGSVVRYLINAWKRVELSRAFGPKYHKFDTMVNLMVDEGVDPLLVRGHFSIYTDNVPMKEFERKYIMPIGTAIRKYNVLTKMGRAIIANTFELKKVPQVTSWKNALLAIYDVSTKEGRKELDMTGAIIHDAVRYMGSGAERDWTITIGAPGFALQERNWRRIVAAAGIRWFKDNEVLLRKAIKRGKPRTEARARRALERWGLDPDDVLKNSLGDPSDDPRVGEAANRIADYTMHAYSALDIPIRWFGPYGRVLTQFKAWTIQQGRFVGAETKHAFEELRHGNPRPFLKWLAGFGITIGAGEAVIYLRNQIAGRKREEKETLAKRLLMDYLAADSLGQMSYIIDAITYNDPYGVILGPTAQELETGLRVARKPSKIPEEITRRVPVVGYPAARRLFKKKEKAKSALEMLRQQRRKRVTRPKRSR